MAKRIVFNEYKQKKIQDESIEFVFDNEAGEQLTIVLPPFAFIPKTWQDELQTGDPFKQADVLTDGKAKELEEKFDVAPTMFLTAAFEAYGFDMETLGKLAALGNVAENTEQS